MPQLQRVLLFYGWNIVATYRFGARHRVVVGQETREEHGEVIGGDDNYHHRWLCPDLCDALHLCQATDYAFHVTEQKGATCTSGQRCQEGIVDIFSIILWARVLLLILQQNKKKYNRYLGRKLKDVWIASRRLLRNRNYSGAMTNTFYSQRNHCHPISIVCRLSTMLRFWVKYIYI